MDPNSPISRIRHAPAGSHATAQQQTAVAKAINRGNAGVRPASAVPNSIVTSSVGQNNIDAADACATSNTATNGTVTTIDGVSLTSGMVVLLTGQTDATQNGLWNVTASGGVWTKHVTATNAGGGGGSSSSGSGGSPTGSAGGDLSGSYPNPTVAKINGSTPAAIATSGSASDLSGGTVPTICLGSGTANNTTFLRGDQTWAAPSSSGVTSVSGTAPIVSSGGTTPAISISDATATVRGAVPTPPNDATKFLNGTAAFSVPVIANLSGSVQASQMPALTGDVTTSAGAVATTIAANAVTNAKAAQMAANTIKGNNAAGTANAADLTVAQTKTLLGLAAIATSGSASDLASGTAPTARLGSGSASSSTFLRGDQTWATPLSGTITAYAQKSANYTVTSSDNGTFFDVSTPTTATQITLPTGVSAGFTVWVRKSDAAAFFLNLIPNVADGINGGSLGSENCSAWGQQYYGACVTYTGVAGNGAGQGWVITGWILPGPVLGQVLRYDSTNHTPLWSAADLAHDVSGTLLATNFPALSGDVATTAGSLTTAIGANKITSAMLAASSLAQILMRVCRGA